MFNSKSPASFVAAGVQDVLSSRSDHCTLRGFPPAPRANKKRSSVTTNDLLSIGALAITAAGVPVANAHSYNLPSSSVHPTRFSPHVSNAHDVAGCILTVSGRSTPNA